MNDVIIDDNTIINKAIIGSNAVIGCDCKVGDGKRIAVIASNETINNNIKLEPAEVL